MKMYQISSWEFKITEVEITRKSESSVWFIHNGRERRESNTYYFDNWELARQSIIDRESRSVQYAEQNLERAKENLTMALSISQS